MVFLVGVAMLARDTRAPGVSAQPRTAPRSRRSTTCSRQQIVRIQPGQTVEWTNEGAAPHTATADDGSWDSGDLPPGATFSRTFEEPGIYAYYCRYHGSPGVGMIGTVAVGDVPLPVRPGR